MPERDSGHIDEPPVEDSDADGGRSVGSPSPPRFGGNESEAMAARAMDAVLPLAHPEPPQVGEERA